MSEQAVKPSEVMYRGFIIYGCSAYRGGIGAVRWTHPDYDGPGDDRHGECCTVQECRDEIDCWVEEEVEKQHVGALRAAQRWIRSLNSNTLAEGEIDAAIRLLDRIGDALRTRDEYRNA